MCFAYHHTWPNGEIARTTGEETRERVELNHACSAHAAVEAARHPSPLLPRRVRPIRGFAVLVVNGEWGGGTAVPETVHVPIIQMRILASRIVVLLSSQRAASSGIHPLRKLSLWSGMSLNGHGFGTKHIYCLRAYLDPCPEPSLLSPLLCIICKRHACIFPGRGQG